MLIHQHPFHPSSEALFLLNESDMEFDEALKISTVCFLSCTQKSMLGIWGDGMVWKNCRRDDETKKALPFSVVSIMHSPRHRRCISDIPLSIFIHLQETNANSSCSPDRMKGIASPHENDVLMGRGGKNNQHSGNEKLRALARERCENYRIACKKVKSDISRELVRLMRQLDPPSRWVFVLDR